MNADARTRGAGRPAEQSGGGQALTRLEQRIDKEVAAGMSVDVGGVQFRTASEVVEWAKLMAEAGSAVPRHLRGEPGACLGILDDAIRFRMNPFALARKSYFVNDQLAYEAQVIAAIVIARAPVTERPEIEFSGEGQQRRCTVRLKFAGNVVREYVSPPLHQIHPKNSPLWKSDPDQQLSYYSLRAAARRHCPEVLLGIYDEEEMSVARAKDATPPRPSLAERLAGRQESDDAAVERDASIATGFDADHVHRNLSAEDGAGADPAPGDDADIIDVEVSDVEERTSPPVEAAAEERMSEEDDGQPPAEETEAPPPSDPITLAWSLHDRLTEVQSLDDLEPTKRGWFMAYRPVIDGLTKADLARLSGVYSAHERIHEGLADLPEGGFEELAAAVIGSGRPS